MECLTELWYLPLRQGLPEKATHDYRRNGTTTLFAALEVATGKVTGEEEYWSRTDLWDFQANVDGARVVVDGVDHAGPVDAHDLWHVLERQDFHSSPAMRWTGKRAFEMAGLAPRDIDVVELYDAFTINTILFLEDLGFCKKGEGGAFVVSGAIAPGGALPVNTNGGGLSCVHPGMYGMFTLLEAVQQLRGEAGARQVAGAELALCHGNGGVLSSQVSNILGTEATL